MQGKGSLNWKEMTAWAVDAPVLAFGRLRERLFNRRQHGIMRRMRGRSDAQGEFREMAFTFAVIALAARLSRVDGAITQAEFLAFREAFPMPASEHDKIRGLFAMAMRDNVQPAEHARRIASLFPPARHRRLLRDVLSRLLHVALADGPLNAQEEALLREVARHFHIGQSGFRRLRRESEKAGAMANPYAVLGVKEGWSDEAIRREYHRLIREYHPDSVQSQGGSAEAVEVASRQVAQINAAYHAICTERRT